MDTQQLKSIVRFKDGSKGTFMVNGIADPIEAQKVLMKECVDAVVGLVLVPTTKHISEPEVA